MTTDITTVNPSRPYAEPVIKVRHPLRWLSYGVLAVLLAMLINTLVNNPRYEWSTVGHYFTSPEILHGLARTVELTLIAMVVGIALGVLLAVMRISRNPALSAVGTGYVWLFRGTPIFVQMLFWGYISALYPQFSIGIPFGPHFASASTNSLVTPFVAALLALGLNEGAYMAEIVRAGILSVDSGQTEAALALGMSRPRIIRRIVLPQAMRVIIPPTGNETISMLKTTSLVSVLAFPELLYAAQLIYSTNFKTIPLLVTASLWYLLLTTILTIGQFYLERRFSRSDRGPAAQKSTWRRILTMQRRTAVGAP